MVWTMTEASGNAPDDDSDFTPLTPEQAQRLIAQNPSLSVWWVLAAQLVVGVAAGPAARAGVNAGDIILQVGDKAVGSPQELAGLAKKLPKGEPVPLERIFPMPAAETVGLSLAPDQVATVTAVARPSTASTAPAISAARVQPVGSLSADSRRSSSLPNRSCRTSLHKGANKGPGRSQFCSHAFHASCMGSFCQPGTSLQDAAIHRLR